MATVTTTRALLWAAGAGPVALDNTGSVPCYVEWEGDREFLCPPDPVLVVDPQGRPVYAWTTAGSTTVTTTATTVPGGLAGTGSITSDDIVDVDGGTP